MKNVLELVPRLDAAAARRLARLLMTHRGYPLGLDATAVTVVSALALEVIIAAARQWHEDHQQLTMTGWSDAFAAGCTTLALDPQAPWIAAPIPPPDRSGAA